MLLQTTAVGEQKLALLLQQLLAQKLLEEQRVHS
jgi:hypothetical protein